MYTERQRNVTIGTAAIALTSTGDKATLPAGYFPIIVRGVALVFTVAGGTGSLVMAMDKRVTAGSDTGRGAADGGTITVTAANATQGKVIYKDDMDVVVLPGQELVFEVTTALTTAGTAWIIPVIEETWERPGNNTRMLESTT